MSEESREVTEQLRAILRGYEFQRPGYGAGKAVALTAEQLVTIMESSAEDIARYAHNRAVDACVEFLAGIGRIASAQLLHHLRAPGPAVPVVEAAACGVSTCDMGAGHKGQHRAADGRQVGEASCHDCGWSGSDYHACLASEESS